MEAKIKGTKIRGSGNSRQTKIEGNEVFTSISTHIKLQFSSSITSSNTDIIYEVTNIIHYQTAMQGTLYLDKVIRNKRKKVISNHLKPLTR